MVILGLVGIPHKIASSENNCSSLSLTSVPFLDACSVKRVILVFAHNVMNLHLWLMVYVNVKREKLWQMINVLLVKFLAAPNVRLKTRIHVHSARS